MCGRSNFEEPDVQNKNPALWRARGSGSATGLCGVSLHVPEPRAWLDGNKDDGKDVRGRRCGDAAQGPAHVDRRAAIRLRMVVAMRHGAIIDMPSMGLSSIRFMPISHEPQRALFLEVGRHSFPWRQLQEWFGRRYDGLQALSCMAFRDRKTLRLDRCRDHCRGRSPLGERRCTSAHKANRSRWQGTIGALLRCTTNRLASRPVVDIAALCDVGGT